jgi:Ger(x)C family germination protein
MFPLRKPAIIWILPLLLLSGCWDLKDPQDIHYVTAIGFDYVDDHFEVYVQMVDFSAVAKTEIGQPGEQMPSWIGKGTGKTASVALSHIYDTAQLRIFYGHINAVVYSERLIKHGLQSVLDIQNRFYEMRYTPWVYGTNRPIEEIFAAESFFRMSPTVTLMHMPENAYSQKSAVQPKRLRELISGLYEPGMTFMLPSLGIDEKSWSEGNKPQMKLKYDGVFAFHDGEYKGRLEMNQLAGLRWVRQATERGLLLVRDGERFAEVTLEKPKVEVTPHVSKGKMTFDVDVRLKGYITERLKLSPIEKLEEYTEKMVKEEILATVRAGMKIGADPLKLENTLYRKYTKQWKELREQMHRQFSEDDLNLNIQVNIKHSGKLEM